MQEYNPHFDENHNLIPHWLVVGFNSRPRRHSLDDECALHVYATGQVVADRRFLNHPTYRQILDTVVKTLFE